LKSGREQEERRRGEETRRGEEKRGEEEEEEEDEKREEKDEDEDEEDEEDEEEATDIKSNNPHLAGGEKTGFLSCHLQNEEPKISTVAGRRVSRFPSLLPVIHTDATLKNLGPGPESLPDIPNHPFTSSESP